MKYRKIDKYKYLTVETETRMTEIKGYEFATPFITLWPYGKMFIWPKYAWNGSSWSIDYKSRTASLWHDALYQLMREGLIDQRHREYADSLYREILLEKGLWKAHADFRYNMLRWFGGTAAKLVKNPEPEIFEE